MKFINKRKIITIKINHPGHNEALLYFDKHSVAATPPSKGEPAPLRRGETFAIP